MANVFDVAKYILEQLGEMSTWKLQKLCYYAQAWELAWTGSPLFPEDFQAWRNGPVCRELFDAHKGKFSIKASDLPYGNSDLLTAEQKGDIDIVLRDYGSMQPYELREQTHSEDPWINARGGIPDYANCETVIPQPAMAYYYGSL